MTRRARKPPPLIAARLHACLNKIQQKAADGYLITSRVDQYYLTGFDGEDGGVLVLPDRVYLLTDGRFKDEAKTAAPWAQAVIRQGRLWDSLAGLLRRRRIRRLAFEPESVSVRSYQAMRKAIRPTRLVALPGAIETMRLHKDAGEVAAIERAIRVAERAFQRIVRRLRPGMSERELAADLQHEMLRLGASDSSFPIIVAEGLNAAFPHAKPGDRRIKPGSAVLIDWGATVDHYRSDLTRVVFIRNIPARFRRLYEAVLAAQNEAIDAIRPGVRVGQIDGRARRTLKGFGLAKAFSHSTGHGLGLDIHEPPRVTRAPSMAAQPLEPGMVVTVEPGVYLPGVGGVRIEDDVLVTEDGHRVLSTLPKDLDSMVV